MKPSITTWPASVPVMVLLWPLASRATANSVLAAAVPSKRREGEVGDSDPIAVGAEPDQVPAGNRDALLAEEDRRRQHQNGGVDEEGDGQGRRPNRWC